MKLQHLKDKDLELSFHNVIKSERKIIHVVILHVQEVARRKLYLARGYGSLYKYLTSEMKYSGSAAQRRIDAAKLMKDVPEVSSKLENGQINLSQITEMQRAFKDAEKIHQEKVTTEVKANLVEKLLNQNTSQTQQICALTLNIPVIQPQTIKTQKDASKLVSFAYSKTQFKKYEMLRDFLANKNFQKKRTQQMPDVLETIFDDLMAVYGLTLEESELRQMKQSETKGVALCGTKTVMAVPLDAETTMKMPSEVNDYEVAKTKTPAAEEWKTLTPKRKNMIRQHDQCCQYTDHESGRVCGSKFNLHIDHIQPKWAGGSNQPSNLRVLCREHNLYRERTNVGAG